MQCRNEGYYIVLISIHGLIRGHHLELGRDADTGGQIKYVVELARALSERPEVAQVDIFTRMVVDPTVSSDYGQTIEPLSEKARIVRIECGEERYIPKEQLWDSLENFSDNILAFLHDQKFPPSVIHSHYADAGYVGTRLSHQLAIPLVHTGHSLGHNKRKQLLASGIKHEEIEHTYNISRRIEAEEATLGVAERIIASTSQEIEQQYGLYDFYQPERMRVIPPGTDLAMFSPPVGNERESSIAAELRRFLKKPEKPFILAISRPDPRKNIVTLIEAYGESPQLQKRANLVIVAGNRQDINELDSPTGDVLNEILLAIDKYDLYGKVAYPKHHTPDDVPTLYRLAALSKGLFVNPALTEPFGLTLIEAAACGLPIVATEDGGPTDIIDNCQNGLLINPLDRQNIADTLIMGLKRRKQWQRFSDNGLSGVRRYYSWQAHVSSYLSVIQPLVEKTAPITRLEPNRRQQMFRQRAIFTSLDLNLIGNQESLPAFIRVIQRQRKTLIFGIATGRRFDDALLTLKKHNIPQPDVLISGQGTAIHYAPDLTEDSAWKRHINHQWNPQEIRELLKDIPYIRLQAKSQLTPFKISYYVNSELADIQVIRQLLLRNEQAVNFIFSFGQFLDLVPIRASKGLALRWCADQLGFQLSQTQVAGVTAADADMLRGNTLGTVVNNRHLDELSSLANLDGVYFSDQPGAAGILEAMAHYSFIDIETRKEE